MVETDDADAAYELLDSGRGRKLERVGPWLLERQGTCAWWQPKLPAARWDEAHAIHIRSKAGGGHWQFRQALPEAWTVTFRGLQLEIRPTPFGHLGLFPEHESQWQWMRGHIEAQAKQRDIRVLNLFAYTGAASICCAQAGARVTHVDAAAGIIRWAQQNATLNGVGDRIQWITDDAMAFVARELRRGRRYDGILLDPPTFGRSGARVWSIEEHLPPLLANLAALLTDDPLFFILTCHTPGFTPMVLSNLLAEATGKSSSAYSAGELLVVESTGRPYPAGAYARFLGIAPGRGVAPERGAAPARMNALRR